jgi:HSP20 family protein
MGFRDLILWSKNQQLAPAVEGSDPFFMLHREVNRLIDDVSRGFAPVGHFGSPSMEGRFGWPKIEVSETSQALKVSAELPGMAERDVEVQIANGFLTIRGETKAERTDEGKYFIERFYGSFERHIPLEGVREDKAEGILPERRLDHHGAEIRGGQGRRQTHRDCNDNTMTALRRRHFLRRRLLERRRKETDNEQHECRKPQGISIF